MKTRKETTMTALLVEDDLSIRKGLRLVLEKKAGFLTILGEAGTVEDGYKLIAVHEPDVLFLDIQLTDGSSFDILEKIRTRMPHYQPQLVFLTAYQEFALKAFRFSALDYLLKPIDQMELEQVLSKLKEKAKTNVYPQIELLLESLNKQTQSRKIALQTQQHTHILQLNEIIRLESDVNYTKFFLSSGKQLTVTKTLKEYEEMLSKEGFERVHQSHLINIHFIKLYDKKESFFKMNDDTLIPVSSRKKEMAQEIINRITN